MRDVNYLLLLLFLFLNMYHLNPSLSSTTPKPTTHHQCLDHQKSALSLLQQNLVHSFSDSKAELWDLKTDCCSWEGVQCDDFGHVSQLDFSLINRHFDLVLQKPILETVFKNLSFLEELNLDFVKISVQGNNWCELFSQALPNLRVLSLSYSRLTGPLCSSLSKLRFLEELNLESVNISVQGNNWCEVISQALPNLRVLSLSYSGPLCYSLSKLHFLLELNLDSVDLSVQVSNWCELISNALPNLRVLSLSGTGLTGPLCSSLSNLRLLKELYLKSVNISVEGNNWCELFSHALPNLRVLSLIDSGLTGPLCSLSNLHSLSELYLDYNRLLSSNIPPNFLVNSSNLVNLTLGRCGLTGSFPTHIFLLPKLQHIVISGNPLLSGELPEFPFNSSIQHLSLHDCKFSGVIPPSLANLTFLDFLDLGGNSFRGSIPPFHRDGVPNLSSLNLNDNQLDGILDSSLLTLPSLQDLDLSSNELKGELNEIPNASSSLLTNLYLTGNNLNGSIPRSIFELPHLTYLDLSNNRFSSFDLSNNKIKGHVPDWTWKGTLRWLDLSYNPIDFPKNPHFGMLIVTNSSFPSLSYLSMRHCDLTSSFPDFIKYQKDLVHLDLSDNHLSGQIPNWIWNISFSSLNLSHNKFHSFERFSECSTSGTLGFLTSRPCSDYNRCNRGPDFIDMSYNNLSGQIPDCLGNFGKLKFLDLQRNNFNGVMPSFALASGLKSLKISGNKVEGKLPISLTNCSNLEVLDLGDNRMQDIFPFWLEKLPRLQVLILRKNRFYGGIGHSNILNTVSMLHVLDLSCNEFTGDLSKEFVQALIAMQVTSNKESKPRYIGGGYSSYYTESIMNKGLEMKMEVILTTFTCLDLSQNRLHGEIPEEIRYLKSLKGLNLSHNNFTGQIPSSMRNLTELESLDFSNNKLSGEIPPQLTSLTSLEVVNFSYNQLEGSIPQAYQFGTFSNDSYVGNPRLCGPPFTRKCGAKENKPMSPPVKHEENLWTEYILVWKIVGMGYASGLVIGFSIGYTIFSQMRIKWFVNLERRARKHGRRFRQRQRRLRNGR